MLIDKVYLLMQSLLLINQSINCPNYIFKRKGKKCMGTSQTFNLKAKFSLVNYFSRLEKLPLNCIFLNLSVIGRHHYKTEERNGHM